MSEKAKVEAIVMQAVEFLLQDKPEAPEPTLDMNIKNVGLDSLDVVELLMEIEEEYSISIPDEEVANCDTIQDVVDLALKIVENNG
jgi:acyl carrier protein